MLDQVGLYVHFPWCVKKCPYCDFNSHPLKESDDFDAYLDALLQDWHSQPQPNAIATVFLGGGTPSLFPPEAMHRLLKALPLANGAEVTMEANPGTTEHADFAAYRQAGVNRLSIGAQSFNTEHLNALGRIHAHTDTLHAYEQARQGGFERINLDLMWALPGQTVQECLADLHMAIDLAPEHISWYQLTIEAKTEFARRPPQLPHEDHIIDMGEQGGRLLTANGYHQYEVSAFAQQREECLHNLNYWQFGDYLGIGAGAHGKVSHSGYILRTQKPHQPRLFLADPTTLDTHQLELEDLPLEFMLNALRLKGGVPFSYFDRTGIDWQSVAPKWQSLVAQGLVREDRIGTTELGYRYLDSVVAHFLPD